jgi:hypothetical protein
MKEPIEIFFSYAHEDETLMDECRRQLRPFERQELIRKWHDRQIPSGSAWKGQIDERLSAARIILLFVSPHFFDSDYCYDAEMTEALRRQEKGEARVIPIILRPCIWETSPFSHLQVLPRDGKPVTTWTNQDEACLNVAKGIMRVVLELNEQAVAITRSSQKRDNTVARKKNFSVQLAVFSPDGRLHISFGITRHCYSEEECVYTIDFVLRERVGNELRDRIKLNVRADTANNRNAERAMEQGLSEAQLRFLGGPVTDRAKTLPSGTAHDKKLIALLRQTLNKNAID